MLLIFSIGFILQVPGAVSLITNGPTNLTKVYSSSTVAREDVNFECQFDGSQNVTIEWFFSSIQLSNSSHHTIINSYNSSVLTILSANVSDIGAYICNVSNDVSSETRTAYLAVLDLPTLLTQPSSNNATEGTGSVAFTCDANGHPVPIFTWKKDNVEIQSTNKTEYLNDGKRLVIHNLLKSDAGRYTCQVFQPSSNTTLTSDAAALVVYYIEKPVLQPPSRSVTLKEGEALEINCTSDSLPLADIKWINKSSSQVIHSNTITANPISRGDAGSYVCNASNVAGESSSDTVSVTVQYLDKPTFNASSSLSVAEGTYLAVKCDTVANPSPQYTWIASSGEVMSSTRILSFPNVNRSDSKTYICVANNSAGIEQRSSLSIDVKYIDRPVFNTTSNTVEPVEDSFLSVNCSAEANPSAQYKWSSPSGDTVSNTNMLSFPKINRNDAKTYTCEASNAAGLKAVNNLIVNVKYIDRPVFNTTSNTVEPVEDSFLSVNCSAEANPSAQYKWSSPSGDTVSNTNMLSFPKINRNDAKTYTCEASNAAGLKAVNNLIVNVKYIDRPVFNTTSNTVEPVEDSFLSVNCSAEANPSAQYKWSSPSGDTVSNTNMLSFPKINRNDAKTYTCEASNAAGLKAVNNLIVNVKFIDAPVYNTSSRIALKESYRLVVSCNAAADPLAKYQWLTHSGRVLSNSEILSIEAVSRGDSGVYFCTAANVAGTKRSANLTLDVQYLDTPIMNITGNSIVLNETDRLVVGCKSTANPIARYQWRQAAPKIISYSSVLTIESISRRNSSSYVCTASNDVGEKSANFELTVHYLDKPSFNATRSVNITESMPLHVLCSAISLPQAQFDWSKSHDSFSVKSPSLIFNSIERTDSGIYQCEAKNSFGTKVSETLTVNVQYIDKPSTNASIHGSRIIEGSPFALSCTSEANPPATYEWRKASGVVVSRKSLLSFRSIHRNDTDTYTCVAKNDVASTSSDPVRVDVQSIDQPNFNSTGQVTITEGASFVVECFAVAYPVTSFSWETVDGVTVSKSALLKFESIRRSNSSVYRCVGSNAAGTRSSLNLTITVQYIDVPTLDAGSSVTAVEYDSISITCSSVSLPAATYRWRDASGKTVSQFAELKFNRISRVNASSYKCEATNAVATRSSQNLTVLVQYLDAPTTDIKSHYSNGSTSSVRCSADGYPTPQFIWSKNSVDKSKTAILLFDTILVADAGNYKCVAKNVLGSKDTTVNVNVTYKPVISFTSSKSSSYLPIDSIVTLSCNVNSVPTSTVELRQGSVLLKSNMGSLSLDITLKRSSTGEYSCSAVNFEGSTKVKRNITVQEPPFQPQSFGVSQYSSRWVLVAWQEPLFDGNSRILNYNLMVKRGSATHFNWTGPNTNSKLQVNVTNLEPFTTYTFYVAAINKMGRSSNALIEQKTDSEAPPVKSNAISRPVVSSDSVAVQLKRFEGTYGPISFYQVIVVKGAGHQAGVSTDSYTGLAEYARTQEGYPYITAEFSSTYFGSDKELNFVIGDKLLTSRSKTVSRTRRAANQEYYNQPLEANTNYRAFLRGFITSTKYSSTNWIDFKTKEKDTGLGAGAIVGIVFGVILFIALIAAIGYFVKKRIDDEEKNCETGKKPRRPSLFKGSFHKHETAHPTDPVPIDLFELHVNRNKANGSYGFSQEYARFDKKYKHPYSNSSNPVNTLKNRYANIHSYDHSRVILQRDGRDPGSDYINANYIHGYNGDTEYIATQGPLPETISDFWRMVWEQSCTTIVMVTNCVENGRPKCAEYWPVQGSVTYTDVIVNAMDVLDYPDHVVTTFHLTKAGHPVERIVKHFHYISWPDHGVPSDPSALFSIIKKVNRWRDSCEGKAPLIVHCSAGVGRTGTYIVLDSQMNRVKEGESITVYSNVASLRDSRYLMVQTEDQYAYLHYALLEFIKSGDTEIEAHELRDYIKRKSEIDTVTGSTGMMDEFVALAKNDNQFTFNEANKSVNQAKNRYKNVYPYDSTRVKLSQIHGTLGSDYINASYIDGYVQVRAFVATQAPLSTTLEDFWRMIWEVDSRSIVMLSKEQEGGKVKVNCYWPTEGFTKMGTWIIEVLSIKSYTEYVLREFKITNSEQGQSRVVRHYQYIAWPENGPPESGFGIIDLIGQVSKWNMTMGNKIITVHCSAGVGRTGVFIALTNLIERLKTEAVVDVYQAVKRLRQQRTAMVQTKGQYEFCYRALQEYLDSFDHYSNFE